MTFNIVSYDYILIISFFTEILFILQEAIQEFSYTTEESRLVIVKAELALKKEDADKAIDILNEVKPGQPYYFQAHTRMAHIYLKEKNDRSMFMTCFKDVVNNQPNADVHVMMADAYMSINGLYLRDVSDDIVFLDNFSINIYYFFIEPEEAAEAYEIALKENPKNIQLVKKLGTSLVKMHEFNKATTHYENAIKTINDDELKYEYIELLIKVYTHLQIYIFFPYISSNCHYSTYFHIPAKTI